MDYISVSLLKAYDEDGGGGGGEPTTPSWVLSNWEKSIYIYGFDIDSVVGTDVNWVVTNPINVSLGSNSSGTTTVTAGSPFSHRIIEPVVCQYVSPMSFTLTLRSGNQIGSGDVLEEKTYTKVVDYDFRLEPAASNMVGLWTFNFEPEAPAGSKNSWSVYYSSLPRYTPVHFRVGLLGFDHTNPNEVISHSNKNLPSTCGFTSQYQLNPLNFSGLSLGDVIEIKMFEGLHSLSASGDEFYDPNPPLVDTLTHTLGESYSNEY